MTTTTREAVTKRYRILGHTMAYGEWIIATNRIWNDERGAYDHFTTLYRHLDQSRDKKAPVVKMIESDDAFADEGHATAWGIEMIIEHDAH